MWGDGDETRCACVEVSPANIIHCDEDGPLKPAVSVQALGTTTWACEMIKN